MLQTCHHETNRKILVSLISFGRASILPDSASLTVLNHSEPRKAGSSTMDSLLLIGRILESLIGFGHNKSLVG